MCAAPSLLYSLGGGMYFDDFAAIVRRNKAPWSRIQFAYNRFGPGDVVTVLDYAFPRRLALAERGSVLETGHSHEDWYIESIICNVTKEWQGPVPHAGQWQDEVRFKDGTLKPAHWKLRPTTGYRSVLCQLLESGTLWPSDELDRILNADSRRHAKFGNHTNYRYID